MNFTIGSDNSTTVEDEYTQPIAEANCILFWKIRRKY
jgi:hypothetical protein